MHIYQIKKLTKAQNPTLGDTNNMPQNKINTCTFTKLLYIVQ